MTSWSQAGPSGVWSGRGITRPPTPAINPSMLHRSKSLQDSQMVLGENHFVWHSHEPVSTLSDQFGQPSQGLQFPSRISHYNPHINPIPNQAHDISQLDYAASSLFEPLNVQLETGTSSQIPLGTGMNKEPVSENLDEFTFDDFCSARSSVSATQSHSSLDSLGSRLSPIPKYNKRRRRGRSAVLPKLGSHNVKTPVVRRYQCTFCTDTFKTKYDWQRHEATIHLSLDQWNCTKSGPFVQELDGILSCIFCGLRDPLIDHFIQHRYSECLMKPPEERLFRRKDHLRQHLRIAHNGCSFNEKMESWFSSIDEVNSRCGFCDARLGKWTERQRHLAQHFKKGEDMKDWKGDRGFDDHIENLVENDMPVFMIGDERRTMEPFSATQLGHQAETETLNIPALINELGLLDQTVLETTESKANPQQQKSSSGSWTHSYRQVEALLLAYVLEQLSRGRVPCDKQLHERTSEFMYGPDNAWDKTWADNPEWFQSFKKKAGLISLPFTDGKNAFIGSNTNEPEV